MAHAMDTKMPERARHLLLLRCDSPARLNPSLSHENLLP